MSRLRQFLFCLAATAAFTVLAQHSPLPSATNLFPLVPQTHSPVIFFRQLLAQGSLNIALPEAAGMPKYLVLSAPATSLGISVEGLWKKESSLATGFLAQIRLQDAQNGVFNFAVAPGRVGGLVPSWKSQNCESALMGISVSLQAGNQKVLVHSNECPDANSASSALQVTNEPRGLALTGTFQKQFTSSSPNSLRAWLGQKQTYLFQAGTDFSGSQSAKVAGAAAVLKASQDSAAPNSAALENFGLSTLFSQFLLDTYWAPRLSKAQTGLGGNSDNLAYWACNAPFVSSGAQAASENLTKMCQGQNVNSQDVREAMGTLKQQLQDVPLVPESVQSTVAALVDILSIQNPLFVGRSLSKPVYKSAPDDDFAAVNEFRKTQTILELPALTSPGLKTSSDVGPTVPSTGENGAAASSKFYEFGQADSLVQQFRTVASDSLPPVSFSGNSSQVKQALAAGCNVALKLARQESAQSDNGAGNSCGMFAK